MSYPKPSGSLFSQQGLDQAGAWHNYFLDSQLNAAINSGEKLRSPNQFRRFADSFLTQGLINSTEKSYLYQYASVFDNYYNSSTDHWERGTTNLSVFAAQIKTIHDSAAIDSNVVNSVFKVISNVALGSSEYWRDSTPNYYPPADMSIIGVAVGDVVGVTVGVALAIDEGLTGWEVVGQGVVFGALSSLFTYSIGKLVV
ncbi:MAG: hypothetical protein JNJ94_07020 [Chlorobi bacterium]|nr:hypothetical protein [Chlorobiota bacterium]